MAQCVRDSSNPADFKLFLWEHDIDCDIDTKSILFTVQAGTYGLAEERKCSNWKLRSYGDFTSENILQSIQYNKFVLDEAWHDFFLVSEVLGLLESANHPDDPSIYGRTFLANLCSEDCEGKTKLQIEQMLSERKHQELIAMQTREIRERIAEEQAQSALLHSSIVGLMEEFSRWQWEKNLQEGKLNYEQLQNGQQTTSEAKEEKFMKMMNMNCINRKTGAFVTKWNKVSLSAYLKIHFHTIE